MSIKMRKIMELIISDISGEERVVVRGKGWFLLKEINPTDTVKCKEGWVEYWKIK